MPYDMHKTVSSSWVGRSLDSHFVLYLPHGRETPTGSSASAFTQGSFCQWKNTFKTLLSRVKIFTVYRANDPKALMAEAQVADKMGWQCRANVLPCSQENRRFHPSQHTVLKLFPYIHFLSWKWLLLNAPHGYHLYPWVQTPDFLFSYLNECRKRGSKAGVGTLDSHAQADSPRRSCW